MSGGGAVARSTPAATQDGTTEDLGAGGGALVPPHPSQPAGDTTERHSRWVLGREQREQNRLAAFEKQRFDTITGAAPPLRSEDRLTKAERSELNKARHAERHAQYLRDVAELTEQFKEELRSLNERKAAALAHLWDEFKNGDIDV